MERRDPMPPNEAVAEALEQTAALLDERGANPHRVQAYLTAADTVRHTPEPLAARYAEGGVDALKALPGVGESLASRIAGFLETGRLTLLHRLRTDTDPARLFTRVSGIGPELARRIVETLEIDTLEALEVAAHDGRLATVPGFGQGRVRAVRHQLGTMLGRSVRRHLRRARRAALQGPTAPPAEAPPVEALLNVDLEYRFRAARGELELIAPRRFNPEGVAWLPVLHTRRGAWHLTALFSNTARAHELGKTEDWVVLYAERAGREVQCTVVTETRGEMKGQRVVRGREAECARHHARTSAQAA